MSTPTIIPDDHESTVIPDRLRDVQHTLRYIALELGETNDRRTIDSVMQSVMGLHSDIGETIADFECGWAVDLHDAGG